MATIEPAHQRHFGAVSAEMTEPRAQKNPSESVASKGLPAEGWQLFPGLVSQRSVTRMNDWLTEAITRAESTPSLEPEFETDAVGRHVSVRKLRRLFWNDEAFWSSVLAGPFAQLAVDLVGPGASLVFHASFLKSAAGGSATPFHQDPAFWRYSYPGAISMWLALDRTDENNGCLQVCDGSHQQGVLQHRPRADWIHAGLDIDAHGLLARPVEMEAGDVIVWDKNLVHGSGVNHSSNRRWGFVAVIADSAAPNFRAFDSAHLAPLTAGSIETD